LGNQLFGYFAGRYLAEKLGTNLILDDHQLIHNKHPKSSIFDFWLENCTAGVDQRKRRIVQLIDQIPLSNPTFDNLYSRFLGIHISRQVGFDPNLYCALPGTTLIGYFQTFKYFFETTHFKDNQSFSLKAPSAWYQKTLQEVSSTQPIIMHVRRGDYSKPENREWGMLSQDYFLDGLELLRKQAELQNSEVWVFSDSLETVKAEFGKKGQHFRFVEPAAESTAAESLLIMANGGAIIGSNSTFSYWSALLSKHQNVIAPSKWFQSRQDPLELIPPNWSRQESVWL
jgi:hypothetical protein